MKSAWQAAVVLVLVSAVTTISRGQFSTATPIVAQETQARGYWVDSSTGLMWAGKDSGKRFGWHKATKYCRNLRLAGYSDWRLATIDELESLVNLKAYATEHVGSSDILHWNGGLQVNGGLLLTYDRQWSSSPLMEVDGRPSKVSFWYFDYREGRRWRGFEDYCRGRHHGRSLCARDQGCAGIGIERRHKIASGRGALATALIARAGCHNDDPVNGKTTLSSANLGVQPIMMV